MLKKYLILSNLSKQNIICFLMIETVVIALLVLRKRVTLYKALIIEALGLYLMLLYTSTVFARIAWHFLDIDLSHPRHLRLRPFYSWYLIIQGNKQQLLGNCMNILAFIPIGASIPTLNKKMTMITVVIWGGMISLSIELFQLLYCCGMVETDDLIHNISGAVIGYYFLLLVRKIRRKMLIVR